MAKCSNSGALSLVNTECSFSQASRVPSKTSQSLRVFWTTWKAYLTRNLSFSTSARSWQTLRSCRVTNRALKWPWKLSWRTASSSFLLQSRPATKVGTSSLYVWGSRVSIRRLASSRSKSPGTSSTYRTSSYGSTVWLSRSTSCSKTLTPSPMTSSRSLRTKSLPWPTWSTTSVGSRSSSNKATRYSCSNLSSRPLESRNQTYKQSKLPETVSMPWTRSLSQWLCNTPSSRLLNFTKITSKPTRIDS